MPDYLYLILLLIAPTLLVWRWNWLGVWLGALTLCLEIVILTLWERRSWGQLNVNDWQAIAVSALLGLLYGLLVTGCKSWYKTLGSKR